MAETTMYTALLVKSGDSSATWKKLLCIKDYPDQSGDPETIETTTLCDDSHTYIPGLKGSSESYSFTANFSKADYEAVNALAGKKQTFRLNFGKAGSDDQVQFECNGYVSVRFNSGNVNAVREMSVVITPESPFELKTDVVTFTE